MVVSQGYFARARVRVRQCGKVGIGIGVRQRQRKSGWFGGKEAGSPAAQWGWLWHFRGCQISEAER